MDYFTYEERLKYLHEMALKGRLISVSEAARKMDCSSRTIKRMLSHLRLKGHDIRYSYTLKRFVLKIERE
ncbi:hypothetical protein [Desertivirga xinjiangensis]|uniref:hypothetical protein n=1 Tax=Desertivirga xinjiangensis TaxID=539206 RepID=UPI00210D38FE|nr:hypothetical protein [Pedobacter xinjiangensis]